MSTTLRNRPEMAYSAGFVVSFAVLGAVSGYEAASRLAPEFPWWLRIALPFAMLLPILAVAVQSRITIREFFRDMSPAQRVVVWLAAVSLFLSPTVLVQRDAGLAGLFMLLPAAAFAAASEGGAARYLLLCGFLFLMSTGKVSDARAFIHASVFAAPLVAALAYGHFFLASARFREAPVTGPWRPLRVAVGRLALAGVITVPLVWISPIPPPVFMAPSRGWRPRANRITNELGGDFGLLRVFLFAFFFTALLLALLWLARWLYQKTRRKPPAPPPESIGVPVGSPYALPRARRRSAGRAASNPREMVAEWYRRLADGLARRGEVPRTPGMTAREFCDEIEPRLTSHRDDLRELTARFERARYAPENVTRREAGEYRKRVKELLAALRRERGEGSGPNTEQEPD